MTYAALARELGAETRQFKSVAHAVLWYIAQKERRSLRAAPMERGASRAPQSHIDSVQATYARLIPVMESQRDAADVDDEFLLFWRRVDDLSRWYANGDGLQGELGLGEQALAGYCRLTESVLRRRLEARGMLA